jgi:hypothetical protein
MSSETVLTYTTCIIIVLLPWERFQEIKHMLKKHSMHGLFLTCTQNLIYIYLHNTQSIVSQNPFVKRKKRKKNPDLHGGQVFCSWRRIPIHSGPLPGSNCPTPWIWPPSPLSYPFSPITRFTMMTSTITVFLSGTLITCLQWACAHNMNMRSKSILYTWISRMFWCNLFVHCANAEPVWGYNDPTPGKNTSILSMRMMSIRINWASRPGTMPLLSIRKMAENGSFSER